MFFAHYNKGQILFYMQDYHSSLKSFEKADSLWHNESKVLMWKGKNYYHLSKYDKALEVLNSAIEINPVLIHAYQTRLKVWREKGNEKKARDDLRMAIELTALGMR